jgi:cytochrome c biogenesis protein CcmG, thiol:disulfide interchange protein DsbE
MYTGYQVFPNASLEPGAPQDSMKGNHMDSSVFRLRLQKWAIYLILTTATVTIGVIVTLTVFPPERSQQPSVAASSRLVGKQAPDFTLPTLDRAEVSLSQFDGKPVLINFWASWCLPCREEMPELVRSYESYEAEDFIILGLNLTYSDTLPDVQAFVNEFNITFPVLLDKDGAVAERLYQIPGVPTSIFINRDATIERIQVGIMTPRQIDQYVAEILR